MRSLNRTYTVFEVFTGTTLCVYCPSVHISCKLNFS